MYPPCLDASRCSTPWAHDHGPGLIIARVQEEFPRENEKQEDFNVALVTRHKNWRSRDFISLHYSRYVNLKKLLTVEQYIIAKYPGTKNGHMNTYLGTSVRSQKSLGGLTILKWNSGLVAGMCIT